MGFLDWLIKGSKVENEVVKDLWETLAKIDEEKAKAKNPQVDQTTAEQKLKDILDKNKR